jgi:SAM-dependent methyltransferase
VETVSKLEAEESDYGNWVSLRLIYVFGAVGAVLFGLSFFFLLVGSLFVFLILMVSAFLSLLAFVYFVYARYKFSPGGGNVQAQILELVLARLDWEGEGRALDIGCGNASLTIMVAKRFPDAHVTGIDYWGGTWEYSKSFCERNAEIEGVGDRVNFQKASASSLPFEDEFFDVAVSNLVFHEVKDAKDKRLVVKEALRVLKKGGKFAFQDEFLMKRMYGEVDDLLETIRSWGIESVEFVDTSRSGFIPGALKLPFMVGAIGIIHGKK